MLVRYLTRVEQTTDTALIHPSCSNKQSSEYRLNIIELNLQMTNKPNKNFLGEIKRLRIEQSGGLDDGELTEFHCILFYLQKLRGHETNFKLRDHNASRPRPVRKSRDRDHKKLVLKTRPVSRPQL